MPFAAEHVADDPQELDILFPATKHSLARMLRAYDVDLGLCTGFPWLIPAEALAVPRLGIVNGHPSLLPRYRGPFPIAWAVRNGEPEIGLTYHLMDAAFDTGNLLAQGTIPLDDDETEETLIAKLRLAAPSCSRSRSTASPAATAATRRKAASTRACSSTSYWTIDPGDTVAEVHRQVRAWSFMPPIDEFGPFLEHDGRRIKVKRTSLTEIAGRGAPRLRRRSSVDSPQ